MSLYPSKLSLAAVCLLMSFLVSAHVAGQTAKSSSASESSSADGSLAQSVPGQADQTPQPGELGSPFPAEHSWNHFALEVSGGYTPVVSKGKGYFNKGFNVTAGVIDRLSSHWALLAEVQIIGLRGSLPYQSGSGNYTLDYSNTVVALDLSAAYDLLPKARTSPYVIGGAGYYRLGPLTTSGEGSSDSGGINATSAGYNGGLGIRHKLYAGKRTEIYAEGRYHYLASGSSDFGQISLFPISAGIRW